MFDDLAFMMYAAECEGDMDTRQGRINRAIKELRQTATPNDPLTRSAIYNNCGLYDLTFWEESIIHKEVNR